MSALYFIFLDFNPSGAVSLYEVLYLSPGVYYPSMSLRLWYDTERDSTFVTSLCVNNKKEVPTDLRSTFHVFFIFRF